MQKGVRKFIIIIALGLFPCHDSVAQDPPAVTGNLLFVAQFSEGQDRTASLHVTFYGIQPKPKQTEDVLRNCLKAAIAAHRKSDITAQALYQVSPEEKDQILLTLADGSNSLLFSATDQSVRSAKSEIVTTPPGKQDDAANPTILEDEMVVEACREIPAERVKILAREGGAKKGSQRKDIVKVMRSWCKENDIPLDRNIRSCMSAVSKAIVASADSATLDPEELSAAITRGAAAYTLGQCAKCHQDDGRGNNRGPDLTDSVWDHCDGGVAGIRKILVAGVPQSRVKDTSRTFGMNPATNLITDDSQISDLAIYVHSLSQK